MAWLAWHIWKIGRQNLDKLEHEWTKLVKLEFEISPYRTLVSKGTILDIGMTCDHDAKDIINLQDTFLKSLDGLYLIHYIEIYLYLFAPFELTSIFFMNRRKWGDVPHKVPRAKVPGDNPDSGPNHLWQEEEGHHQDRRLVVCWSVWRFWIFIL